MGFRDDVVAVRDGLAVRTSDREAQQAGRAAAERLIEYAQRYHQSLRDEMADELVAAGDTTPARWSRHRWYAALELTDEEIAGDVAARGG